MYQIIYQNESVGYTDKPNYVKLKNDVWINCEKADAEAIAINSTAYQGAFAHEVEAYDVIKDKAAQLEQIITDIEIAQIEDELTLTDHDIAIMELQAREE